MGVRLLSSIFGKNPSPSPTGEASPPQPAKSPVAKIRFGAAQSPKEEHESKVGEAEDSVSKKTAAPSKIGIGVGGNVLAEMKARQERRISGILHKQNSEESDVSEVSDKAESKSASTSPNPLGGIRLRPTAQTPEDADVPPKLPEKTLRFKPAEEADSDKSKSNSSLFRLRSRIGSDDSEAPKQDERPSALNQVRLRSTNNDEGQSTDGANEKANPLSGVKLRSTGISVTDKASNEDNKSESRNSLSKLKPPPLAPKPRPWSVAGSDKKNGR